ncbi:MAG: hypothetical protein RIB32_03750 [Phycisphaerales bacterium]
MPMSATILLSLIVLATITTAVLTISATRRRRKAIDAFAASEGLVHEKKVDRSFRDAWAILPELSARGAASHLVYGRDELTDYTIFEHTTMTMAGQTPVPITHTIFAAEAPADLPELHVLRKSLFRSIISKDELPRRVTIPTSSFPKGWVVHSTDGAFATRVLNEAVCPLIGRTRHDRAWRVFGGKAIIVMRRQMDAKTLRDGLDRLRAFARNVIDGTPIDHEEAGAPAMGVQTNE